MYRLNGTRRRQTPSRSRIRPIRVPSIRRGRRPDGPQLSPRFAQTSGAFASAQIKSVPAADAPDAERQTVRCRGRAGILVPGKRKTQQSRTPLPKRSGFAVPLVRCFVLLRSLRFCLLVFQLGFQEQVDILRKGSVILLCPFAQLRQQIPVYRDADFLFQWFHMITRCQYSRTMRKTLDK